MIKLDDLLSVPLYYQNIGLKTLPSMLVICMPRAAAYASELVANHSSLAALSRLQSGEDYRGAPLIAQCIEIYLSKP